MLSSFPVSVRYSEDLVRPKLLDKVWVEGVVFSACSDWLIVVCQ